MARELVGEIGVDSGQVIIIDPGYLNDPKRWNPKRLLELAEEHFEKQEYNMGHNTKRLAKEKQELQNMILNWPEFCKESTHEPREYAGGVISPTRHGDGGYPVYVTRDKEGRVKKLEVVF
jgi:hypothetical protein